MMGGVFVGSPMKLPECACGGQPYIDWWFNFRTKREESFVRCPQCQTTGPGAPTDDEAVATWTPSCNADTASL